MSEIKTAFTGITILLLILAIIFDNAGIAAAAILSGYVAYNS